MDSLYAGVIVELKVDAVDRIFQYEVPKELTQSIAIGHRVLVPFGPRKLEGYVVELSNQLQVPEKRLRSIIKLLDPEPIILPSLVQLAYWMQEKYVGLLAEALQYMLPPGFRYGRELVGVKKQQQVRLIKKEPELRANATVQRRVVQILQAQPVMLAADLVKRAKAHYSTLQALEDAGIITIESIAIEREVEWDEVPDPKFQLTKEQETACRAIRQEYGGERKPVLIHGVTGSGKTEVYLRIISEVIKEGKQAIVLVPEISLTPQTVNRFGTRFGKRVTVLHSALSPGERFDQWWKIYRGEVDVVVGARSAVFAPTPNLGLIVLDEEHEGTYKQEEGSIRYHTREAAIERCKLVGGQVLLGSATPSLESYHRALQGNYRLVELTSRVQDRPLPKVKIVDMRKELEAGNRSMFSRDLQQALIDLQNSKEQAIILLNRRGFSAFLLCRECGHVLRCPNCQVSLTYHQAAGQLRCHYCQYFQQVPQSCPNCASRYLRQFGVGTEQVQSVLQKEFPQLKTLRLDADTTRTKGAHASILKKFAQGGVDVLVGTQMVAKGLDFPNVTLVGVLSADLTLNFPDIRAAERTFQLLTQVAGRSGRGERPGKVIIQAYEPEHFSLTTAQNHDYLEFYRREISFRRSLGYPPFRQLTRILCSGPLAATKKGVHEIYTHLLKTGVERDNILGPAPAPINRIKGRYRWQLVLKSDESLAEVLTELPRLEGEVQVTIDIDPLFLL